MARPKKDNADYFSHDADMRNDLKIKALRNKFGMTGYAFWNMLLEVLTNEDHFEYPYNSLSIELLSGDFGITREEVESIIDYCVTLDLIQISEDKEVMYSEKHQERFTPLLQKRERDREYRLSLIKQREGKKSKKAKEVIEEKEPDRDKSDELVDYCKEVFSDYSKSKKNVDFIWGEDDEKEFQEMVEKIVEIRKRCGLKGDDLRNSKQVGESLKAFLDTASKDKFLFNIFSPHLLNKQFNQISSRCVESNSKNNKTNGTADIYDLDKQAKESKSHSVKIDIRNKYMDLYFDSKEVKSNPKTFSCLYTDKIEHDYKQEIEKLGLPYVV